MNYFRCVCAIVGDTIAYEPGSHDVLSTVWISLSMLGRPSFVLLFQIITTKQAAVKQLDRLTVGRSYAHAPSSSLATSLQFLLVKMSGMFPRPMRIAVIPEVEVASISLPCSHSKTIQSTYCSLCD